MNLVPASRSTSPPLGTSGDLGRRALLHHLPLALATAVALILWMRLPLFEGAGHQGPPQAADQAVGMHGPQARGQHGPPAVGEHAGPDGGVAMRGMDHSDAAPEDLDRFQDRRFMARLTTATGYGALAFLAVALLIGPANLLLRRRNPVSNHLRRDVGAWTAMVSVVHVIAGFAVHGPAGPLAERILRYFFTGDGRLLTNAFGLGNWTGLAATLIAVGLLAMSSDFVLRKLKAGPWKWLQRLNYALFALVIAHAVFYGALTRVTSPSTLLLGLSVFAVFVGQATGVWLWRRAH